MVATCDRSLRGPRDRALLLVRLAAALRRSELVALELSDAQFSAKGVRLRIARPKMDQKARGEVVGIVPAPRPAPWRCKPGCRGRVSRRGSSFEALTGMAASGWPK